MSSFELLADGSKLRRHRKFRSRTWTNLKTSMPRAVREALREEFPAVAVQAFDRTAIEYWREWLSDENLDALTGMVLVFDEDGQIAGWVAGSSRRMPRSRKRVFYASSAGTRPDVQGSGIATIAWMILIQAELMRTLPSRLYVTMRTANPVVYRGWSRVAGGARYTFPAPNQPLSDADLKVALTTARMLGQEQDLDRETLKIKGAYTDVPGGLWDERPASGEPELDDWFQQTLGPEDAFLMVLHFDSLRIIRAQAANLLKAKVR